MPIESNGRGRLCEPCQKIFRGQQILSADSTASDDQTSQLNYQAHHSNLQSFLKASDSGCPVCYEFWSSIGETRLEIFSGLSTPEGFSYWELERREGGGYDLTLALDDEYDELIEDHLELDLEVLPPHSMLTKQMCSRLGRLTYSAFLVYDGSTENNSCLQVIVPRQTQHLLKHSNGFKNVFRCILRVNPVFIICLHGS